MESVRLNTARRVAAAASLVLAPVLLLVAFASHPADASTGAGELRVVAAQTDRWNLVHLVFLWQPGMASAPPTASGPSDRSQLIQPERAG